MIIVALDFSTFSETNNFLNNWGTNFEYVKIGMELFYGQGPSIIKHIKERNLKIFLDLKLHDIPTTVEKSLKKLIEYDIDMINIHVAGGSEMMKRAKDAVGDRCLLIGVTQLTSTSERALKEELLINHNMNEVVSHYSLLAKNAGLDGVVCSALESPLVKMSCGNNFLTVTPGIRLSEQSNDDHARLVTPAIAKKNGSDYLVIGRPITQAENPKFTYESILEELKNVY